MASTSAFSTPPPRDWPALGLDPRLLRAISRRNFPRPTSVQRAAISDALRGTNLVCTARTGSGKTLAYLLPVLHVLLASPEPPRTPFQALILVPTRELCEQVLAEALECLKHLGAAGLGASSLAPPPSTSMGAATRGGNSNRNSNSNSTSQLRAQLAAAGGLVITTPARLATALRENLLPGSSLRKSLRCLVLDEADLLLSYGYQDDLRVITALLPNQCQTMLFSATTSAAVDELADLVLVNPTILDLAKLEEEDNDGEEEEEEEEEEEGEKGADKERGVDDDDNDNDNVEGRKKKKAKRDHTPSKVLLGVSKTVAHYSLSCKLDEKLLHLMCLLRLGVVNRKVLVFVNTIPQAYKVKLFLEAFGVRAALLNAELPLASRHHTLQQFNKGLFDFLIATDGSDEGGKEQIQQKSKHAKFAKSNPQGKGKGKGNGKGTPEHDGHLSSTTEEDFGVVRGVDFKDVRTVVNFDLPTSITAYVHRVGRTGRAGQQGTAVSLVAPTESDWAQDIHAALGGVGERRRGSDPGKGTTGGGLRDFTRLRKDVVDGLRYRATDQARALTKAVIGEARVRDIKMELLNSERLQLHFDENPKDREVLRHDKPLTRVVQSRATRALPSYIRQKGLAAGGVGAPKEVGVGRRGSGPGPGGPRGRGGRGGGRGRGQDPLKAVGSFMKMAARDEGMTPMEVEAMKKGRKLLKKRKKAGLA